jgi:hypothetical protein
MKKYFAWVFFLIATINVPRLVYYLSTGSSKVPPTLYTAIYNPTLENIGGAIFSFVLLGFFSLCLYLWWHWK